MLKEISQNLSEKLLTYNTPTGTYSFNLSSNSRETEEAVDVVFNYNLTTRGGIDSMQEVELCKLPTPVGDRLFEEGSTIYRLVNGLINHDGFYIAKNDNRIILKFVRRDVVQFQIAYSPQIKTLEILRFRDNVFTERGDKRPVYTPLYDFLLAAGVVRDRDEYNVLFSEEPSHSFYYDVKNVTKSKEELAERFLKEFFGVYAKEDSAKELQYRLFDLFVNTNSKWYNKHVFFSFARFKGYQLLNTDDPMQNVGIIDDKLACQLDNNHHVTKATILIGDEEVTFEPDKTDDFTKDTFIKVIKLYLLVLKFENKLPLCDENAIFNRKFYMFYDYITDYVVYLLEQYVANRLTECATTNDFMNYLTRTCPKAKEVVSVPNCIAFYSLRYTFAKDIFRNSSNFGDQDRYIHPSYLGWISPTVSSDGEKIGLTGCLDDNTIYNNKLARKFTRTGLKNDESEESEVILEPWQTYNKIIGLLDTDTNEMTYLLNGNVIQDIGIPDLMLKTSDIYDPLTGSIIAKNSNHPKRDILGFKAINQSMPMINPSMRDHVAVHNRYSDKIVGKTVREVLDEISSRTTSDKIYTEDSIITLSQCTTVNLAGKDENEQTSKYEESYGTAENKYYLTISVDGRDYSYKTLRYILAATQNTRLYFSIVPPLNGISYSLDEYLIVTGEYESVGEELNVIFGNFDGGTYEDGTTITTDLADSLVMGTKVYFHEDLDLGKLPQKISDDNYSLPEDCDYLDRRGLPKIGTFICKGQLLASVELVDDEMHTRVKRLYSEKGGFVESIQFKGQGDRLTTIRVILSEIRKIREGDKTGNGHGNKGVVVYIIDSEQIQSSDGTQIDFILNPLGTVARMNMGQIKEGIANKLSLDSSNRIDFADSGIEHYTIEELVDRLKSTGNYNEVSIIYKGRVLRNKFFISKLKVYRTEHISTSKIKYLERPSHLNINGVVDGGQKMSELSTLTFSCYDSADILSYLINYQSRTPNNYRKLRESKLNDLYPLEYTDKDITPFRINAFFQCVGLKFSEQGVSFLLDKDVRNLQAIAHHNVAGTIMHDEKIHGKFDINKESGYFLKARIVKPYSIIMPAVLKAVANIIPTVEITYENDIMQRKACTLTFKENSIGKKIIEGYTYIYMHSTTQLVCISKIDMDLYNQQFPDTYTIDNWGTGYAILVSVLSKMEIGKFALPDDPKKENKIKDILNNYGPTFFKDITLSGIPIAPINLRPLYTKEISAQGLDRIYRGMIMETSDAKIWSSLEVLTLDINNRLTAHGGSKEDSMRGLEAHGEKNAELRDNMFARYFSNSCRSVAGFDFNLDIDHAEIPLELAFGMVRSILIDRLVSRIGHDQILASKFMNSTLMDKDSYRALRLTIRSTINAMLSNVSYDKELAKLIMDELTRIYEPLAAPITREPVLNRRNTQCFSLEFTTTSSIKMHPLTCAGYNMDFDGDQLGCILILDETMACKAMMSMSPFNSLYDYNTDKTFYKPQQDVLFGLYLLTKPPVSKDSKRVYFVDPAFSLIDNFIPRECEQIVDDYYNGIVEFTDTITVIDNSQYLSNHGSQLEDYSVVTTVGKFLFASCICGISIFSKLESLRKFIEFVDEPLTSKTNNALVMTISKVTYQKYENQRMMDDSAIKRDILGALKRFSLLGIWSVTYQGVTLGPTQLSGITTLESVSKKKSQSEESYYFDLITHNSERLFLHPMIDAEQLKLDSKIHAEIHRNPFINDLLISGARGKEEDFFALYGYIGSVSYLTKEFAVKNNYNRGIGLMDKLHMSMPVRASNVRTQKHLGIDGGKMHETAILSSKLSMSKSHSCGCEPDELTLEYDYYYKGHLVSEYKDLDLSKDEFLFQKYTAMLTNYDAEDSEFNHVSGSFLQNLLHTYDCTTLFGEPLEKKLNSFYRKFISPHYVIWKSKEYLGSSILSTIDKEQPRKIKIYSVYSCISRDGICKHCYGAISEFSEKQGMTGNIGINTIFDVGSDIVQKTLDSAKNTKGTKERTSFNIFDLFVQEKQSQMCSVIKSDLLQIERVDSNLFKIIPMKYSRRKDKDGNNLLIPDAEHIYEVSGSEFDTSFLVTGAFIPNALASYESINGNNKLLFELYIKMLKVLSSLLDARSLEVILAINTRYMYRITQDPANATPSLDDLSESDTEILDTDEDEKALMDSETSYFLGIIPISPDYATGNYNRVWLSKTQAIAQGDLIAALCLGNAFNHTVVNAMLKRSYDPHSAFSSYSFDILENSTSPSSIMNYLMDEEMDTEDVEDSNTVIASDTDNVLLINDTDASDDQTFEFESEEDSDESLQENRFVDVYDDRTSEFS